MLQFRLRTLFIATTASAVLFGVYFAPPQWLGLCVIYLVYLLLPAATVSGIVFHRGYPQAFFIGLAPWIVVISFWMMAMQISWVPNPWPFDEFSLANSDEVVARKLYLAIPLVIAMASGLVSVGVRWWAVSLKRSGE